MQRDNAAKETAAILNDLADRAEAEGRHDKAEDCRRQAARWTRLSNRPLTDGQFALARRWGEAYPRQDNDRSASRPKPTRPTTPPRPKTMSSTDNLVTQYQAEFQKLPRRKQRQGLHNFACSRAAGLVDAHGDATPRPRPAAPAAPAPAETPGQAYARAAMEADKRKRSA